MPETANRPEGPPSILLISMDTTRADKLGAYDGPPGLTPHLDRIARQGWVFERTVTPTPVTLPAHATLLTGLGPDAHGVRDNGLYRLPAGLPTLAEALRQQGYATGAVVAAAVLDRQYGLDRGFDLYDDSIRTGGGLVIAERDAAAVTAAALGLADRLDRPFFLLVHYFDPHADYAAPPAFRAAGRSAYESEIAYVDDQIGELLRGLDERGIWTVDDDIVSVVADHGESLGEHGEPTHGVFLYQSTLHVPWLLSAPGRLRGGTRIASPTSLADVAPTLLELVSLPPLADADGRSQIDRDSAGGDPPDPVRLLSEFGTNAYGFATLHGAWDGRWKWIDAPRPELYDLDADPAESRNLHELRPAVVEQMQAWLALRNDASADAQVSPEELQQLQQLGRLADLGYVSASRRGPSRDGALPDPKDGIGTLLAINAARASISAGAPQKAAVELEAVVRQTPDSVSALVLLGSAYLLSGRPAQALPVLDRAAERAPHLADIQFNRGLAHLALGRPQDAERAWRETLDLAPRYLEATANLADLLRTEGKPDESQAILDAAENAGVRAGILDFLAAKLAVGRSDYPGAQQAYERALRSGELPEAIGREAAAALRALRRRPVNATADSNRAPASN